MKYLCFVILFLFTLSCKNNETDRKAINTRATTEVQLLPTDNISNNTANEQSNIVNEIKNKFVTTENPDINYTEVKYYQWELNSLYDTILNIKGLSFLPFIMHRAAFAYYLKFDNNYDSCRLIGWSEWLQVNEVLEVKKIDQNNFIVNSQGNAYYEFKFNSDETISMREVGFNSDYQNKYLSYRGLDKTSISWVTVMASVEKIAEKLLIGKYEVIYKDSINCEKHILFDKRNKVVGIDEYTYYFLNMGDPEYPSDYNSVSLTNKNKSVLKLSFSTNMDTLALRDVGKTYTDPGSGTTIRKEGTVRLRLLKIK